MKQKVEILFSKVNAFSRVEIFFFEFSEGDYLAKALCVTVKDHANETVLMAFVKSQVRVIRAEAKKEGIEMKNVHLQEGENYSCRTLTKLWMTQRMHFNVSQELRPAIQKLQQWLAIKIIDDSLSGK